MNQLIETLTNEPEYLLGAMGIVFGISAAVIISCTAMISDSWRRVRQTEDLNALKMQMLQQGRTPDEIVKVLSAGQRGSVWRKQLESCQRMAERRAEVAARQAEAAAAAWHR